MSRLSIEQVDVDGALREGAERVEGDTRAGFMAKAAIGAGGLIGGGAVLAALPGVASAATRSDVAILNFALTLEYLEQAFYAGAIARGAVGRGQERAFALTAHSHESAHVAALQKALGSAAIKRPTFNFGNAIGNSAEFVKTAIVLEDTGACGPTRARRRTSKIPRSSKRRSRSTAWRPTTPPGSASSPGRIRPTPARLRSR